MECRGWAEQLVETARRGDTPAAGLDAHLRECERCRERWNAERSLAGPMLKLRQALAPERSPAVRRRELLAAFMRLERREPRPAFRWAWAAGMAAALLAIAFLQVRWARVPVPAPIGTEDSAAAAFVDQFDENGLIPVPYALPLATGESVRIVRREVNGAELARMGIEIPGLLDGDLDADVVFGEDGFPRAVHLVGFQEF